MREEGPARGEAPRDGGAPRLQDGGGEAGRVGRERSGGKWRARQECGKAWVRGRALSAASGDQLTDKYLIRTFANLHLASAPLSPTSSKALGKGGCSPVCFLPTPPPHDPPQCPPLWSCPGRGTAANLLLFRAPALEPRAQTVRGTHDTVRVEGSVFGVLSARVWRGQGRAGGS